MCVSALLSSLFFKFKSNRLCLLPTPQVDRWADTDTHNIPHLCQYRKDGPEVSPLGDELQGDKVLNNGLVVSMDQVTDGLNHPELDIVVNLGLLGSG